MDKNGNSKVGLERAAKDVIKVAYKLLRQQNDPLMAGTSKVVRRRLKQFERQLQKKRTNPLPKNELDKIATEVADTISYLMKSLIRYLFSAIYYCEFLIAWKTKLAIH